jgi:predicted Holliday junction resolvase-like endonuclease
MATWIWIVIGVALAAVLIVVAALTLLRGRIDEKRRAQAHKLRQEAENRARRANEREAVAKDIASQAREERELADSLQERAAKIDPDRKREQARQAS